MRPVGMPPDAPDSGTVTDGHWCPLMPPDSGTVTDGHWPHLSQDPRSSGPHPRAARWVSIRWHLLAAGGITWASKGAPHCIL